MKLASIWLLLVACYAAQASTITYVTPTGATTGGGAVDASALITTGAGTVSITNMLHLPSRRGEALASSLTGTKKVGGRIPCTQKPRRQRSQEAGFRTQRWSELKSLSYLSQTIYDLRTV
jgi:hypothetical protein